MPENFEWPRYRDYASGEMYPLSFIGQFDCQELKYYDKDKLLPTKGLLLFFYDMASQPWGYMKEDCNRAKVLFFEDLTALTERSFPDDLEIDLQVPFIPITMISKLSFPSWEDLNILQNTEHECNMWETMYNSKDMKCDIINSSKLLGWADVLQNNMTTQCECMASSNSSKTDAETLEEWVLLFQVTSMIYNDYELLFGDEGTLYYYIRKNDLECKRFNDVWCILQC